MDLGSLLIANRGEIAIRIARAAAELGFRTVAVFSEDDAQALHTRKVDDARPLSGKGPAAYLDAEQLIRIAADANCGLLHPGYGFLSENPTFARACVSAGIAFVGPGADTLDLLGDKVRARATAQQCGVPILDGTFGPTSLEDAKQFFRKLGPQGAMVIKALAGGGGRGMRVVRTLDELDDAYARCQSEARQAFGSEAVYVEAFLPHARHIEIQIARDDEGRTVHLGERECSLQRRHQKIVEIAPAPGLPPGLRDRLTAAAMALAEAVDYRNIGTFEFLVDAADMRDDGAFVFLEANPRLQVEHTVTEAVMGIDLVRTQLELARGRSLAELGVDTPPRPNGYAVQARVNLERITDQGEVRPTGGILAAFDPPTGPGVRVDTCGYTGYGTNPSFDPLLAKVIGHAPGGSFSDAVARTYRALCEFRVEGVVTNIPFLQNVLQHDEFAAERLHTQFIDEHLAALATWEHVPHRTLYFKRPGTAGGRAGAQIDTSDPLAVLDHGKSGAAAPLGTGATPAGAVSDAIVHGPDGTEPILAPMQGTIVSVTVREDEAVHMGQQLLVMEAMKMEHVITATMSGYVRLLPVTAGDTIYEGHPLAFIEPADVEIGAAEAAAETDPDAIRPDLAEVHDRHRIGLDEARPDAVERRRKTKQRTARENVTDLCDPESFVEYGPLVIAAQRRRRSMEDLIHKTPADGLVAGIGRVNGNLFGDDAAQCIVMSYDYTVLAGTQGAQNHRKKDRMFELAEQLRLPLVFFTEGGGGRPGDTDTLNVAGLDCLAFQYFGKLSGLVPLVGINSGRCFAGNAALLGCCDVIIATENSNIGMGGPAMIEGGGLGIFRPEEVGPMDVQVPNGVVDIPVVDEAEAVQVAKRYLSYFQGSLKDWTCADQRRLRSVIPENRLRMYNVRDVIHTLADADSVLEIRRQFGPGMVTAFARIEGRPLGVIANNPAHLAGAIDSNGADKAARFMQLCDAFDIPILLLCDTPGIMVGPEVEKTALVRHVNRLFVIGASLTTPFFTIVLRKGYGLGAQAMAGGSFKAPLFTVAWPTAEFGGMGLEGAVKLGFRKELAAIEDPEERARTFEQMVGTMYERGKAVNAATHFEFDDVIDPVDSRHWILNALRSSGEPPPRTGKKRPCIDTW